VIALQSSLSAASRAHESQRKQRMASTIPKRLHRREHDCRRVYHSGRQPGVQLDDWPLTSRPPAGEQAACQQEASQVRRLHEAANAPPGSAPSTLIGSPMNVRVKSTRCLRRSSANSDRYAALSGNQYWASGSGGEIYDCGSRKPRILEGPLRVEQRFSAISWHDV